MPTAIQSLSVEPVAGAADRFGEEVVRDFDVDAGAVAGLAVRVHRAAVPDGAQRVDAGLHHVAPRACRRAAATRPTPQASCSCDGSYVPASRATLAFQSAT